jgi:hypothetical protein
MPIVFPLDMTEETKADITLNDFTTIRTASRRWK